MSGPAIGAAGRPRHRQDRGLAADDRRDGPVIRLRAPAGAADRHQVVTLFRAYQQDLGVDLCFQDFEAELADIDRQYGPPQGGIVLADVLPVDGVAGGGPADGDTAGDTAGDMAGGCVAAGCVAIRPMPPGYDGGAACCEMKRMFVRPGWRGLGLGRRLADAGLALARTAGYRRMRLDTLHRLGPAVALYRSLGFRDIAPYYHNPLPDVVYMEADLTGPG